MAESEVPLRELAPPVGVTPRVVTIPVRFSDVDGMQHVNNAKYLTYTEEARTRWAIEDLKASGLEGMNFILAHARIDFVAPAGFGDTVKIEMWVPRVGTKSWDFAYRMSDGETGRVVATAITTQVAYDYEEERSVPIQRHFRAALQRLSA